MKNITITNESVIIKFGGTPHTYPHHNGSLTINEEQVQAMPEGIKVIFILLAAAKKIQIKNHYQTIREPIWRNLLKEGGLSKKGEEAFRDEAAVVAAAEAHKKYLKVSVASESSTETKVEGIISSKGNPETVLHKEGQTLLLEREEDEREKIDMVDVVRLQENPLNATIYSDDVPLGLLSSIEIYGVRVPIRVTPDLLIIDGHLRTKAAIETGWKKIPVIIEEVPPDKQLLVLLEFNRYRDKTNTERLREFRAFLSIEKNLAAERSGLRTDCGVSLPPGHTDFGKARDLAAQRVGISGSTGERGLRVLEEIENRKLKGRLLGIEEVQEALNKGINSGYKLAQQYGWLDSSVKKSTKNATTETVVRSEEDAVVQKTENPEETSSCPLPNAPVEGWLTDMLIADIAEEVGEEEEDLTKTLSYLRPRLYVVLGTTPEKLKASKLRLIAQAITVLADKCEEISK